MAPVLFIYLMNAFAETLSDKWHFNKLNYNWFPESGNGNKRGRLTGQSPKAMGSKFDLFYFLYVDDGAMLFDNRKDLEEGTKLIMDHFARFGLEMHVGRGDKASKTECVYFPAFENEYEDADTSNFAVNDGFVQFTKQFKYLGSTISYSLNDSVDIDARISQASKAMGALRNYFKCNQVSLYAKRLIYLAIPINLCLWGSESWAISEASLRKLKVFHTRSIRSILKINIYEVQEKHIRNSDILSMFNLPAMENLIAKRHLRWVGKMARMEETRLPIKMLSCWINEPRPARRPHTTTRNSMVRSLQILDPNISNCGTLNEWFQSAKDESAWNERLLALDPPKPTDETETDEHPNHHCPTPERLEDDDTSRTEHETVGTHAPQFLPEFVPWNEDFQTSLQTPTNSPTFHPPQIWGYGLYFPSNSPFAGVPIQNSAGSHDLPHYYGNLPEIRDSESWRYTNHRPPPLVLPHLIEDRPIASHTPPLRSYLEYSSSSIYNSSSCFFL
jgi:hypothetical protein